MLTLMPFLLICGLCLFHARESRAFSRRMQGLADALAQGGNLEEILLRDDWRVISRGTESITVRRAFHVRSREDMLRYGVPVLAVFGLLALAQSWWFVAGYIAANAVRWFLCDSMITRTAEGVVYAAVLFGNRLVREEFSAGRNARQGVSGG